MEEKEKSEKKPKKDIQGTKYSCKHSTVRKKAGTTYSNKYSPKY